MMYKISNGYIWIDEQDIELIKNYSINIANRSVSFTLNKKTVQLGRFLLNYKGPLEVDHEDKNFLNFQRSNLRIVESSINKHNKKGYGKSQYKGVVLLKNGSWQAQIRKDGKFYYLGTFKDEIKAAKIYDKKARELYGEFASCNFER